MKNKNRIKKHYLPARGDAAPVLRRVMPVRYLRSLQIGGQCRCDDISRHSATGIKRRCCSLSPTYSDVPRCYLPYRNQVKEGVTSWGEGPPPEWVQYEMKRWRRRYLDNYYNFLGLNLILQVSDHHAPNHVLALGNVLKEALMPEQIKRWRPLYIYINYYYFFVYEVGYPYPHVLQVYYAVLISFIVVSIIYLYSP